MWGRRRLCEPAVGRAGEACRWVSQGNPGGQHRGAGPWERELPEVADTLLPGKATKLQLDKTVPQTDTGGQDENSQALERTQEKELGKLTP